MTIARNPLHGSGRAVLPHPALASGDNAKSPQGIGMTNARRGQPPLDEPAHPLPGDVPCVTAPRQRAVPEPAHLKPNMPYAPGRSWAPRSSGCAHHNLAQPCAHRGDRVVPAPPKLGLHLAQLRLQPLPDRLPHHREPPVPLLPADVREAEEIERLRLPLAGTPPVLRPRRDRIPAAASSRGAAPDRTSRTARPARPGTARPPPGAETQRWRRPRTAR